MPGCSGCGRRRRPVVAAALLVLATALGGARAFFHPPPPPAGSKLAAPIVPAVTGKLLHPKGACLPACGPACLRYTILPGHFAVGVMGSFFPFQTSHVCVCVFAVASAPEAAALLSSSGRRRPTASPVPPVFSETTPVRAFTLDDLHVVFVVALSLSRLMIFPLSL